MRLLLWVLLPTRLLIWWRRVTRTQSASRPAAPKSFIIFRLDALGDVVLTTPLFRELKLSFPDSRLTAVVQCAYTSVLETNPHIDELLTLPAIRGRWLPVHARRLLAGLSFYWRELRRRQFDVAISPRWDTDEHLAAFLCLLTTARARIGYDECSSPGKRCYNRGFAGAFDICLDAGPLQHEVERNLAVVKAIGGSVRERQLEIELTTEDREYADRALSSVPENCVLIALGIGAQSPGRRWPLERYAAVIDELAMQYPVFAIVTCAPSEHPEAIRISELLQNSVLISDSRHLRETCALLERCDLFMGNDTGAAHLSAAMECPTIIVSRHPTTGDATHPNSPARFAPWGVPMRVLQPERGLGDCDARCREISHPHCIMQISVPQVVAAAKELLIQNGRVRDKLLASSTL